MLSKHLERRDRALDVSVSDIYTENSILTSFIWGSNQRGNVHLSTGTVSSSSSTSFVPTTTSSGGSRDIPGSTADTGGSSAGSSTGVSSTDGSDKSVTYASTSSSGGVSIATQKNGHSSSSSSTTSGSLSANIFSAPSSRPGTVLPPTPTATSEITISYYSAPGSSPIIATATRSVVNVNPTTMLMSDILSSSTFNRPNGHTGGSTSASASSLDNPTVTDNGFLPSSSQHQGISSGAVAAISAIGAVILAALLLFLIRRYRRVRRQWRLTHIHHRADAGWSTVLSSGGGSDDVSSAVTSYVNRTPLSLADPVPPPMAEIRDDHLTRNPSKPRYSTHPPRPLLIDINVSSHSDPRSAHANTIPSNLDSTYLVIPDGLAQLQPEIATPMSVRPFTPSESFKFPKPPSNGEWIQIPDRDSHGTALSSSTEMFPPSPTNPFSEPESPITPELSPIETIRRTFVPTLYDELSVAIGDRIRVLEVFDDGWAMVEKVPEGNGQGKEVVLEPGLIPIDCLRMTGDPLPPFLASQMSPGAAV
ncbi:uncharacterized protein ARMOST_19273 [Armillaria ostoyae]|uniref:SH3 domain-containing protein n=1 Tax=Armillaria ostoyae TaxID=47428 RepID=A0A284S430_ARMOS|nr:uncharacterized protein ARMOST_19273 [Armillaria ostoyae]